MSEDSQTRTDLHNDGTFIRTALVMDHNQSEKGYGSATVAVVTGSGQFLGLLNIFCDEEGSWWAVDVIDTEQQFDTRRALIFQDGQREDMTTTGNLVAADFRKGE